MCPRARAHILFLYISVDCCVLLFHFYFLFCRELRKCARVCAHRACVLPVGMRVYVYEFVICALMCARVRARKFLFISFFLFVVTAYYFFTFLRVVSVCVCVLTVRTCLRSVGVRV